MWNLSLFNNNYIPILLVNTNKRLNKVYILESMEGTQMKRTRGIVIDIDLDL